MTLYGSIDPGSSSSVQDKRGSVASEMAPAAGEPLVSVRAWRFRGMVLPVRGVLALVGGALLMIALSIDFSYSNLNTYVISYLREHGHPDLTYADWQWVSTAKNVLVGLTMPFGGMFSRWAGVPISVTLGSAIYTVGYVCTYWTLDSGLPLVVISMGVCHGIAMSFVYGQTLGAVMKWFPGDPGLMTSICVAGYGFGGVIWNPLETAYVNPDNVDAVQVDPDSDDKYFLDGDLLDRVPSLMLLVSGIFVAMQIPGIILLREPSEKEVKAIVAMVEEEEKRNKVKEEEEGEEEREDEKAEEGQKRVKKATEGDSESTCSSSSSSSEDTEPEVFSVHPRDVLKTKEFYILWVSYYASQFSNGLFLSYSKSYGQIYISDDQYLATAYTVSQVFNGSCRVVWGRLYDKMGFQWCVAVIMGVMAFLNFTFVDLSVFPKDSGSAKAFYMIWIILVYAFYPGTYSCFAPATMRTFGPEHYAANYGLVFTINFAYSFTLLAMTEFGYDAIGYSGLFFIAGGILVIGFIVTCFFRDSITSDHYRARFENKSD